MRFLDLEVITDPVNLPVTEQDFIDHARLNGLTIDRQPALIDRELRSATRRGEQFCRRSFITQTLNALFVPAGRDCAGAPALGFAGGPGESVTSSTSNGAAVDPASYTLEWNTIKLTAPLPGAASVEYV